MRWSLVARSSTVIAYSPFCRLEVSEKYTPGEVLDLVDPEQEDLKGHQD